MTESPLPQDDDSYDGSLDDDLEEAGLLADDLDYGLDSEDDGPSWGLIVGVFVAMGAIAFLVFDGMQSETYFFDVHDAVERSDELVGQNIRVRGDVSPGSFVGQDGVLESQFDITSDGESMTIVYERALPDTFEEDSEIVAEGYLDEGLVLHANEVLVKCPSRYEGAPPTAGDDGYGGSYDGDYDDVQDPADPQASR